MLEIKNFVKRYADGTVAVNGINLKVEAGDIFAFIGHNGAGKTTAIKGIVGIHDITAGDILIDGVSIKTDPIGCKAKIAYVPDNPDIYTGITGVQYLNLIANIFKVEKSKVLALTQEYATKLDIIKDLNSPIATYSHGMRQKLVLISALVHSPKLMVLDEPFVGLDPKAAFELKEIMRKFCADGGAIFFSTHVLDVAEKLCNKVAIIKKGEIIVSGTMSEVKKNKTLEQTFLENADA